MFKQFKHQFGGQWLQYWFKNSFWYVYYRIQTVLALIFLVNEFNIYKKQRYFWMYILMFNQIEYLFQWSMTSIFLQNIIYLNVNYYVQIGWLFVSMVNDLNSFQIRYHHSLWKYLSPSIFVFFIISLNKIDDLNKILLLLSIFICL